MGSAVAVREGAGFGLRVGRDERALSLRLAIMVVLHDSHTNRPVRRLSDVDRETCGVARGNRGQSQVARRKDSDMSRRAALNGRSADVGARLQKKYCA